MSKLWLLLGLLCFFRTGLTQDTNPSFESLSHHNLSVSVPETTPLSHRYKQVSQKFLGLRDLFEALPLLLSKQGRQAFPEASISLKKAISEKALEIASGLSDIQVEDFLALKQSLLDLGNDALSPNDLAKILVELDSRLISIGHKLSINPEFANVTVLPQKNLQAALLLLEDLRTKDFSSNQVGLKTLLTDLTKVLEIHRDPIYGVLQKVLEGNISAKAIPELSQIFETVLHKKDGKDPWHPPISIPKDLSPSQKDQIIASALHGQSRPGFLQRAQQRFSNFLIPAAHAQTTAPPQSPNNSEQSSPRRRLVKLPNGSEYRGELLGKLPHGRGWLKNPNGTSYVGDWESGKPQGHGVLQLQKGNVYSGEIHNGIAQGEGQFTSPDGSVYQGKVHQGRPHGEGKILFPNGIVIEAEFKDGIPDGIALLRDGFGNTSEFSFVDGEPLGDARIFTKGLVLDGWLKGSFDAFEVMAVSDRFGNFLEVFSSESASDPETLTTATVDLPSAPLYARSSQNISVERFSAYETVFACLWNGEVSPFGQSQKLYPHGYGEMTCADGFKYTGLAKSYIHPYNGIISEAHGYGRVTLSSKRKEAVTKIDGNFENGKVIGQARVLFDSGLVFEGRVDSSRVTLNPINGSYRSPAAQDGFYAGSESHPLGNNGVLYLGPVQNGYPHGHGFLKRYWQDRNLAHSERCQYQSLPVFKVGIELYRRAGYCEFKNPNQEEFKGYQYGDTYTTNPDRTYPGALGRGAEYKNGTRWREGFYADNAQYIGQEVPANYSQYQSFVPKEFLAITQEESFTDELVLALKSLTWEEWVDLGTTFIPAGKFANTAVKLWDTYRLVEELRQVNGLASQEEIQARLLDALKQIVVGKALEKVGESAFKYIKRLRESKTRVASISPPANRQELLESPGTPPKPVPVIPKRVQDLLNSGERNVQVYLGRKRTTGESVYVGISIDIARRQKEHGERFNTDPFASEKLTIMEARAIEEYFIEVGGFHRKTNPVMENKKHSISRKNKDYEHYQTFAREWLDQRGLLDEFGIPKKVP